MSGRGPADRQKVVLYNPVSVFYTMPLGLVAVGSALDQSRFEVRIVDGRFEDDPAGAVLAELDDRAICLGVTVLTGAPIRDALEVSRAVRAHRPELPIVWGGWHPSLFPSKTLAEPSIDITVQAQGEVTFREVVESLAEGDATGAVEAAAGRTGPSPAPRERGRALPVVDAGAVPAGRATGGAAMDGIAGTAYRAPDGEIRQNAARHLTDMNELPAHDYDLIQVERYFQRKGRRQLDYIASTGCHFRCAFCADPFVYGRRWTALEPERMGEELEALWRRYSFDDLNFQDETFFTFPKRVARIAEEFLERELRFTWAATLRADQGFRLSEEAFALCVRSGLRRVMIGVESGSQEMLDWMHKDITIEQVLDSAEKCARHGVGAIFPFIVGFPGESDESVRASLELAKRLRRMSPEFEVPVFYFKPYPGSAITQKVVAEGYELPSGLEGWAEFDFIGSSGPWVSPEKYRLIERFKFYNRFAGGRWSPLRWPLQVAARWRCRGDRYAFPLEKLVVERLRPQPRLS